MLFVVLLFAAGIGCAIALASAEAAQSSAEKLASDGNLVVTTDVSGWITAGKRELRANSMPPTGAMLGPFLMEFYPCDKGYQAHSWDDVSVEERMLANGYEILDENGQSYSPKKKVEPLTKIAMVLNSFYLKHGRLPSTSQELYDWILDRRRESYESGKSKGDFETFAEYEANFIESVTSPVTGKPIEWNHQNFSRGNAFVTVLNLNPEALSYQQKTWVEAVENGPIIGSVIRTDANGADNTVFLYFRAYGESGVLVESFLQLQYEKLPAHTAS